MLGNHNEGVQISGGRVDAGAFAVGRGASATNLSGATADPGRREIDRRLEVLLARLDAEGASLEHEEEVRESTQVVAGELKKDKPNKTTVVGVLTGIAGAVTSVAGLATATDALLDAVRQFL